MGRVSGRMRHGQPLESQTEMDLLQLFVMDHDPSPNTGRFLPLPTIPITTGGLPRSKRGPDQGLDFLHLEIPRHGNHGFLRTIVFLQIVKQVASLHALHGGLIPQDRPPQGMPP